MTQEEDGLDYLVTRIRATHKYRSVAADVVRTVGSRELTRRGSTAEAEKAAKRKLHQIAGAYVPGDLHTERWLKILQSAVPGQLRGACCRIMSFHASTRERLPVLDEFYATLLGDLSPIQSMLDIGCGLNPLAIPWMPLAEDCTYHAYDVYEDLAVMLGAFFAQIGRKGRAEARDITRCPPAEAADVALLLKLFPCLEQIECGAAGRLLDALGARYLIVSFPVRSLGGRRDKGMEENYKLGFLRLMQDRNWFIERFSFPTELVFRVRTDR